MARHVCLSSLVWVSLAAGAALGGARDHRYLDSDDSARFRCRIADAIVGLAADQPPATPATPSATPPSTPPVTRTPAPLLCPKFGVNYVYHPLERYLRDHGGTEIDYIAHQNRKLVDLGAGWVRSAGPGDLTGLNWSIVEPREGEFQFALQDARVLDAARRGLRVLGNVDFSAVPDYARVEGSYFDDAKYLAYLDAIVERYDGDGTGDVPGLARGIKHWEIGNEVTNAQAFGGTAEDYAHVLQISYAAIKASCADCRVLVGGWAIGHGDERKWQRVLEYIDTVLAHGGGPAFDIMNFHEYTDDCDFQTYAHVAGLRDLLARHGLAKPFWITEGNTRLFDHEGTPLHTIERQAQDLVKRIVIAYDAGVDVYFWHGLDDLPGSPGVGFYDETEQPKPIYYNLRLLLDQIAGYTSLLRLDLGNDDVYAYLFRVGGYPTVVAWTEDEETTVDLDPYFAVYEVRATRAITMLGQSAPESSIVPVGQIRLDRTPVFLRQTTPDWDVPTATVTGGIPAATVTRTVTGSPTPRPSATGVPPLRIWLPVVCRGVRLQPLHPPRPTAERPSPTASAAPVPPTAPASPNVPSPSRHGTPASRWQLPGPDRDASPRAGPVGG